MTKQAADGNTLKLDLPMEQMNRVVEGNSAFIVSDTQITSELEEKTKVTPIKNEIKTRNSLGKNMPELYNLENGIETEKPIKKRLDLDLYQMEQI